jgi:uncharacterized protein YaaW (UPF0174 family)
MDELRVALELATEDELQDLTELLFRRKFNPLDYLQGVDPDRVMSPNRSQWLDSLEERFRFLAADGLTVLRRETAQISYRQILVQVCRHLRLRFSPSLSTPDLEAEIFLHLMRRSWRVIPRSEQDVMLERIRHALAKEANQPLPLNCNSDHLRLFVEGGGAIALSSMVRAVVMQQLARQFALYWSRAIAGTAVKRASAQVLTQTVRQGMTSGLARYGLARSAFAALGFALWAGLIVDLGWRSISTNYGRIIPMIFTLAQIRLTRSTPLVFV